MRGCDVSDGVVMTVTVAIASINEERETDDAKDIKGALFSSPVAVSETMAL
jgi:hypothetical protein